MKIQTWPAVTQQVTVTYQQCALAVTCACAVEVHVRGTRVLFDRCRRVGATGAPAAMTVTMPLAGSPVFLSVYQHSDLLTYYVSINKKGFCFFTKSLPVCQRRHEFKKCLSVCRCQSPCDKSVVSGKWCIVEQLSVVNDALLSNCQW